MATLKKFSSDPLLLAAFTVLGFAVMGYHPGIEDDGIYLTAIKSHLNPALYPWDSAFFKLQLEGTVFDNIVAAFIRVTHIPLAAAILIWQLASIALIIYACLSIARHLFAERSAQWAGIAMVVAMFTLPVSGSAIYLVDQHLHARNVATALILVAVVRILSQKHLQAVALLLCALLLHPIMAAAGFSFCFFLSLAMSHSVHARVKQLRESRIPQPATVAAVIPLWFFERPNPLWRKAVETRAYFYLYKWTWYEWLGAIGPIILFWVLWRVARKHNQKVLSQFALGVLVYAIFQQAFAMAILAPASLERLTPLQPMRYLQLVYFFLALIGGSLLGKYWLKASVWRWAIFLLAANGTMFAAQCAQFPASKHIEWPGRAPSNPWLQAFAWIRTDTPADAYFVLDPNYLAARDNDYHSFRALAERSQLCDAIKDTAVVTLVPRLATTWNRQLQAQRGWQNFQLADFERLKREFGVDWALVSLKQTNGLNCKWHNNELAVCGIP